MLIKHMMSSPTPQILFLHVPHTGGRGLLSTLTSRITTVHNAVDIEKLTVEQRSLPLYMVFRDPVHRALGEYYHYSMQFMRTGYVNHMNKTTMGNVDVSTIDKYFSLEVNCNTMCKFILLRTDFSVPITEADYQTVLTVPLLYDMIGDYSTLGDLLGVKIDTGNHIRPRKRLEWELAHAANLLKNKCKFDMQLYQQKILAPKTMSVYSDFQRQQALRDRPVTSTIPSTTTSTIPSDMEGMADPMVRMRREAMRIAPHVYAQLKEKLTPEEVAADEKWGAIHWSDEVQERHHAHLATGQARWDAEMAAAEAAEATQVAQPAIAAPVSAALPAILPPPVRPANFVAGAATAPGRK